MPVANRLFTKPLWVLPSKKFERVEVKSNFYNSRTWRKCRAAFMAVNPLCEHCKLDGIITPATVCDHIKQIKLGGAEYDANNLQSLCEICHNKKSQLEGNAKRKKAKANQ
jgi:5-methylcytosine-specific restriction enzyme A